jgi:hypothetical protein
VREPSKEQKCELISAVVDALALTVETARAFMPEALSTEVARQINAACELLLTMHEADHIASEMIELQEQLLKRAVTDRDHWKANHDTAVRRARVLVERPDMPLERVTAYGQIGELADALEKSIMREKTAFMRGWAASLCVGSNLE